LLLSHTCGRVFPCRPRRRVACRPGVPRRRSDSAGGSRRRLRCWTGPSARTCSRLTLAPALWNGRGGRSWRATLSGPDWAGWPWFGFWL